VGKRQIVTEENSGLDAPADALDREIAGTTHISKMFARYGVTSVHHEGGSLPAMQKVAPMATSNTASVTKLPGGNWMP